MFMQDIHNCAVNPFYIGSVFQMTSSPQQQYSSAAQVVCRVGEKLHIWTAEIKDVFMRGPD